MDQIRARARSSVVVSADLHRARSTPGWPGASLFGHYEKVALMSCQVGALSLAPAIRGCLPGRLEADVLVGEISERDPSIRAAARFRVACAMSRPTRVAPVKRTDTREIARSPNDRRPVALGSNSPAERPVTMLQGRGRAVAGPSEGLRVPHRPERSGECPSTDLSALAAGHAIWDRLVVLC